MNKHIFPILIGLLIFFCLAGTGCKYEYEDPYYDIIVINETADELCVLANTFRNGVPDIWEGGIPADFLKPHNKCTVGSVSKEIDINSPITLKIIFMEAVNPDNYVKSRADTCNVKCVTKFYNLPELRAMDWTIVYDGNME